jgi:hypothetical protein
MSKNKPKIFISYAHEDIGMAKQIYNDLKRFGLDVWIDYENLLPGQQWKVAIEKEIKRSTYYIVLLSSHSVTKRGFIPKEMKIAYEVLKQCPKDDIDMIPVRLDNCEPALKITEVQWVDLFPDNEYENGIKKILKVVNPEGLLLRREPIKLYENDATEMIKRYGFYEEFKNPEGRGFEHVYLELEIDRDRFVVDEATGLMWQQSGSSDRMNFDGAMGYIDELNRQKYAGFNDWRLPTLEEAMSLMERERKNKDLHIDPIFDNNQTWIWTSDQVKGLSAAWIVVFDFGYCDVSGLFDNYVRAVRLGQSSEE